MPDYTTTSAPATTSTPTSTSNPSLRNRLTSALGSIPGMPSVPGKNKGGPTNMPDLNSSGYGFYTPTDTSGRSQLLQAMMTRSRSGRTPVTPPVTPTPGV